MTKRICPNCGLPWYSAESDNAWNCQCCGVLIGKEQEVPLYGGDKDESDKAITR